MNIQRRMRRHQHVKKVALHQMERVFENEVARMLDIEHMTGQSAFADSFNKTPYSYIKDVMSAWIGLKMTEFIRTRWNQIPKASKEFKNKHSKYGNKFNTKPSIELSITISITKSNVLPSLALN